MNDNLKQKNILVTGGAGYIGSFMVRELANNGYKVVVLDNLETGHRESLEKNMILELVDLKNKIDIDKVFKKYTFDAVVDFAAYLAVGESMDQPRKYLENNVFNFINLLDVMTINNCLHLIKSSTAATYGNPLKPDDFPLRENYQDRNVITVSALLPGLWDNKKLEGEVFFQKIVSFYQEQQKSRPELLLNDDEIALLRIPTSIYGLTKLLDEIIMKKYDKLHNLKSIALRYFNVCGAALDGNIGEDKLNPTTLMTVCFWNVLKKNDKVLIFGTDYPTKDGTGVRDYIHPLDLASGHLAALINLLEKKQSNIYNLGTGNGYSVLEVIQEVEKVSGTRINTEKTGRRSGDPAVSYSDPSKAEMELNWKAKYNLGEMAQSAWRWHSTHPSGYSTTD